MYLFHSKFIAIALLQDKSPGTFVIRDSQSYTGAFGLAIKVEVPPIHVIQNQTQDFGEFKQNIYANFMYITEPSLYNLYFPKIGKWYLQVTPRKCLNLFYCIILNFQIILTHLNLYVIY